MTATLNTTGNTYVPQYINYELEDQELRMQLTRRDTQLSIALNTKENGVFETVEVQNGQRWFAATADINLKRFAFRKVFSFGAIAAGGTLVINHGLTNVSIFVHIYGTCITDVVDYRPIPYSSVIAVTDQIEVKVTATQIIIDNGATAPNITSGIIVLEYLYT